MENPHPSPSLVEASGLAMRYGEGDLGVAVLHALDLEIRSGDFVVLLGRSGSGKSTLLNLLGGMDVPTAGRLRVGEHALSAMDEEDRARFRRRALGFVFQAFNLLPTLTLAENLALPLALNGIVAGSRVEDMLQRLGLGGRGHRFPGQVSGGEQQRAAIGRALIHSPLLVLADEPTGNLDAETAREVLALFGELVRERGSTIVMATHSQEPLALADRVLQLEHGRLCERR